MSGLVVLDATAAELLAEVHAAAFDRPWSAADLVEMLRNRVNHLLAVREGDAIAGFILIQVLAGEAEILTLAVRPEARRRGLGRRLVEAAAQTANGLGASVLWLEVAEHNAGAIALYRATGFAEAGRRKAYYRVSPGRSVDAIVMRRDA